MGYSSMLSFALGLGCLLTCVQGQSSGSLRLVSSFGNTGGSSGRLEIFLNSRWGTVCDDSFGQTDANVACEQLGYVRASRYDRVGDLGFSQGTGTIWLDEVACSGFESQLQFCRYNRIGTHDCSHSEDVALICTTSPSTNTGGSTTNFISLYIGVSVGIIVLSVVGFICCVLCCVCCVAKSQQQTRNVNRTARVVQPTNNALIYTTTTNTQQTSTAYPQSYPTGAQQAPAAYPTQQVPPPSAYPAQPQQADYPKPTNPELFAGAPPAYGDFSAYPQYQPPPSDGYLPTDPTAGYPPTDPTAGYPPTDPTAGYLPTDPSPGYPPTDPSAGYPPTDPSIGYPPPSAL